MNAEKRHARRQEVIDRHTVLESVPGSGWHADDPGMKSSKLPPVTLRPVAIQDDDVVHIVGPCADVVRRAARDCIPTMTELAESREPLNVHGLHVAERIASGTGDIELNTQAFNSLSYAIRSVGVVLCLTDIGG